MSVLAREEAAKILVTFSRLTVLRTLMQSEPAQRMRELCCAAMSSNDLIEPYHALTAALIERSSRCVTGDLWKDFIFSFLFEEPNCLSIEAAVRTINPVVLKAMRHDLALLRALFDITDEALLSWIAPVKAKITTSARSEREDNIMRMSMSAWGVSPPKEKPQPVEQQERVEPMAAAQTDQFIRWSYEVPKEPVVYAADEALALMYRKFLAGSEWGELIEPLMAFHLECGHGAFLRYNTLRADEAPGSERSKAIIKGWEADAPEWDDLIGIDRQKERLYAHMLRFLHTGEGENVLICGAPGMGKTAMLLSLSREMPDLRVVLLPYRDAEFMNDALRQLNAQPYRTIALLDDISTAERDYKKLKVALTGRGYRGRVMLCATSSRRAPDMSLFPVQIELRAPDPSEFAGMVNDFLRADHAYAEKAQISAACSEWMEEMGELSARAAEHVAKSVSRKNGLRT